MTDTEASSSSLAGGGDALFKKKKKGAAGRTGVRPSSLQQQQQHEAEVAAEEQETSTVVHKKRAVNLGGGLAQRTGFASAKRMKLDEDDDSEARLDRYGDSTVGSVVRSASNGATGIRNAKDDATRVDTWYDDEENAPSSKSREAPGDGDKQTNDDGIYRGASSYSAYTATPREGTKPTTKGPLKTTTNVRTVTAVDYQPDVCKDYKETGYCGFGDTCKFLHDRSDYLAGWQLDLLPNSAARQASDDEGEDDDEEEVPFACLICRQPFTDPVVTRCGHYFCQRCAIKRYAKSPKCFACGAQTQGIFNSATKILDRMARARKRREEEREERRWNKRKNLEEEEGGDAEDGEAGEILDGVEVGGGEGDEEE
ncbi:hypothetical protein FA10DRAFT_269639 [Acaromyces ingoldii]|uniref:Pre-mRNA-splicing factor CWC24 n=1 Tax=Acaromyces ingoldii TaxID=215250 RepID=A0A316YCY1_9BASI|nr:hypothetical protein FA10DRAFT_269639 [Acaromyces ingoldii]PWN87041.1 hypothetical protein FA10DRAFT_269639 [Acaromyces ingoldii]